MHILIVQRLLCGAFFCVNKPQCTFCSLWCPITVYCEFLAIHLESILYLLDICVSLVTGKRSASLKVEQILEDVNEGSSHKPVVSSIVIS